MNDFVYVGDAAPYDNLTDAINALNVDGGEWTLVVPRGSHNIVSRITATKNISFHIHKGARILSPIQTIYYYTISNSSSLVVSADAHGLQIGDSVIFDNFSQSNWSNLNNEICRIIAITDDTFTCPIDTSSFGTFNLESNSGANILSPLLRIDGNMIAGNYQIFDATSAIMLFGSRHINPLWWDCLQQSSLCAGLSEGILNIPAGDYHITTTTIFRSPVKVNNPDRTRLITHVDDGSVTCLFALPQFVRFAGTIDKIRTLIDDLYILGHQSNPIRNNTTGIDFLLKPGSIFGPSQYKIKAKGSKIKKLLNLASWIGDIELWSSTCDQTLTGKSLNGTDIWANCELPYGDAIVIDDSSSLKIRGIIEGYAANAITGLSLNAVNGAVLDMYFETVSGKSNIDHAKIGDRVICNDIVFSPSCNANTVNNTAINTDNGIIRISKVNRLTLAGSLNCPIVINDSNSVSGINYDKLYSINNNWIRFVDGVHTIPHGNENYFPNPYLRNYQGWQTIIINNATYHYVSKMNDGGMKIIGIAGTNSNYIRIDLPSNIINRLKGADGCQLVVTGWCFVNNYQTFTNLTNPITPKLILQTEDNMNIYSSYDGRKGVNLWHQVISSVWCPSQAQRVSILLYLNDSINPVSGNANEYVIFSGVTISKGLSTMGDMVAGRWRMAPEAS